MRQLERSAPRRRGPPPASACYSNEFTTEAQRRNRKDKRENRKQPIFPFRFSIFVFSAPLRLAGEIPVCGRTGFFGHGHAALLWYTSHAYQPLQNCILNGRLSCLGRGKFRPE